MGGAGQARVRCTGCGQVIAHDEHVWIEDEDGRLHPWSPDLGGPARLAARRAWHAACVIDDPPPS